VPPPAPAGPAFFQAFLEKRLPGLEVEIAYPTYTCAGVLCTHGHYLDPHARMAGSRGSRLLTRTLWGIAAGGPEEPTCAADYESVITLLTEWLYIAAQMPHGTHAQQNVLRAAQRAGRIASAAGAPMRGAKRFAGEVRARSGAENAEPLPSARHFEGVIRDEAERQAREAPLPGRPESAPRYPEPTVLSRSSPTEGALEAFSKVVTNLEWDKEAPQIVFAHTHQPLDDVLATTGATRYWNSGCWIYEPDLSSRQAYARYCRYAWPGTAIVIDDAEPQPRLLELLADLNPLAGGAGLPKAPA
jgi:hypothetical protein